MGAGNSAGGNGDDRRALLSGRVGRHGIGEGLVATLEGGLIAGKPSGVVVPTPPGVGGDGEGAVTATCSNAAGGRADDEALSSPGHRA